MFIAVAEEITHPIEIASIPSDAAKIETGGSFADLLAAIALGLICCFIVVLLIRKPALIGTAAISAVGSFIGYWLYWVLNAGNSPATIWVTMLALLLARSFGTAWLEVYQERQNGQSEPVTVQQQQEGEHQVDTNEHTQPKAPEEDNIQPKFA